MPESLQNQFISDSYTSILHLSGGKLTAGLDPGTNEDIDRSSVNGIYDGVGNRTGISLSSTRVVIDNYVQPPGPGYGAPTEWLDAFFPINSIKLTFDNINPGTKIAHTVWQMVSQGRFLVGWGEGTDTQSTPEAKSFGVGNQDGEYSHTLTVEELPAHEHDLAETVIGSNNPKGIATPGPDGDTGGRDAQDGVQYKTLETGDNVAHNNVPPGYGIYVWRRIE